MLSEFLPSAEQHEIRDVTSEFQDTVSMASEVNNCFQISAFQQSLVNSGKPQTHESFTTRSFRLFERRTLLYVLPFFYG